MMQHSTRQEYERITEKFLVDYDITDLQDFDILTEALTYLATNASRKYWFRKRRGLVIWLEARGMHNAASHVKRIQYPIEQMINDGTYNLAKEHRRHQRKEVSHDEHMMLIEYCIWKKDVVLQSALLMAWLMGCCRPIELTTLTLLPSNRIKVLGAKKTEDGLRGQDRILHVNEVTYEQAGKWLKNFDAEQNKENCDPDRAMKRLQRRLENATKALWPERENQITFYTYRHQFASDIKGSDTNRIDAAAMMGHQSVDSLDAYGSAKSASRKPDIKSAVKSSHQVRKRERKLIKPNLVRILSDSTHHKSENTMSATHQGNNRVFISL